MVACEDIFHDSESLLTIPGEDEEKLLPVAAVYGGNAAGKTSFAQSLWTLQYMVCEGKIEHATPFRLDEESRTRSTNFKIVLATSGSVWEYELKVFITKVVAEKLTCVSDGKTVYERGSDGAVYFNADYFSTKKQEEVKIANVVASSIPQENVLLTILSRHQGMMQDIAEVCSNVRAWFVNYLKIKSPNMTGAPPVLVEMHREFAEMLSDVGTGISSFNIRKFSLKDLSVKVETQAMLDSSVREGEMRSYGDIIITKEAGELYAYKYITEHALPSGKVEQFELDEESDGTKSFIHLLPILNNPAARPYVYVIDELDRSLHTKLSRRLIERHLEMVRAGVPQQLIFTTHDVLLMDEELLRKDEIWLADRYSDGTSELKAFVEYKEAELETNMRRSYLQGRMGGVPDINL